MNELQTNYSRTIISKWFYEQITHETGTSWTTPWSTAWTTRVIHAVVHIFVTLCYIER